MPVCERDECRTTNIIHDGTRISDITTDMADIVFLTAVELASRCKRPRGAQGWCAGPGVEAWDERSMARERGGETRRRPRAEFNNSNR